MTVSVIITTCNRADSLARVLEALVAQDFSKSDFEIIVSDNGSRDHTHEVAQAFAKRAANLRYVFDARPGQLVGWHRGLALAQGEITCFIDDDSLPSPTWLAALDDAYRDARVGLVTGPIALPIGQTGPDWLQHLTLGEPGGQTLPFLGLLDCGRAIRDIPGNFVWGTNFTVRRSVLVEVGGFHPGAMPWHLIRFYGDGEVHVGRSASQRGYRVLYHPAAAVTHDVDPNRFTIEGVYRKLVTSGCARAYQTLRGTGALFPIPDESEIASIAGRYFRDVTAVPKELSDAVEKGLRDGISRVHTGFESDPMFRDWIMRPDYLDLDAAYVHPALTAANDTQDWRSGT
jgi:glycosyltransferase involved in cell wall biosynthesis